VLAEAQKLGYAEADPSFDIDGVDASHKLAILASVAFGRPVDLAGVYCEGIRHVSRLDIEFAEELGYRIKLLGIARLTDHGLEQRVHPCMVRRETPIAAVEGVFNGIVAEGDFVGQLMLEGRGAGAGPTAFRCRRRPCRHRHRAARGAVWRAGLVIGSYSGCAD
jgi:homoserine dehydrogenase